MGTGPNVDSSWATDCHRHSVNYGSHSVGYRCKNAISPTLDMPGLIAGYSQKGVQYEIQRDVVVCRPAHTR